MQIIKLLLFLLLFCSACSSSDETKPDIKFDGTKWNMKDGDSYTFRKQMVNDLLQNYKWSEVKKDSLIKMLGNPDEIEDDIFLLYSYDHKYFGQFTKSTQLIFELAPDSTVKLVRKN